MSDGTLDIKLIDTKEQMTDIFTKPLPEQQFVYLREALWIVTFQISVIPDFVSLTTVCEGVGQYLLNSYRIPARVNIILG